VNSSIGSENWPAQWRAKALALHSVNWPQFRRDPALMELIESSVWDEARWRDRADASGIDLAYLADSLYGDPPKTVELDDIGICATATSIRMACYAKTISDYWQHDAPDVLEIGGGYGAMAHALSRRYKLSNYYIIDHESCMTMQRQFIRKTVGVEAKRWNGQKFDLAINTHSFGEMDPDDVTYYFQIIKENLHEGCALYVSNRIRRVTDFEQYPYGGGWLHRLVRHPQGNDAWIECLSVRDRANADKALSHIEMSTPMGGS
jgi:hypothetical protein